MYFTYFGNFTVSYKFTCLSKHQTEVSELSGWVFKYILYSKISFVLHEKNEVLVKQAELIMERFGFG